MWKNFKFNICNLENDFIKRIYNFKNSINCFLSLIDGEAKLSEDISYLINNLNLVKSHLEFIQNLLKNIKKNKIAFISITDLSRYSLNLEEILIWLNAYIHKVSSLPLEITSQLEDLNRQLKGKNQIQLRIELVFKITYLLKFIEEHFTLN